MNSVKVLILLKYELYKSMKELTRTFGFLQTILSYLFVSIGIIGIHLSLQSFFSRTSVVGVYNVEYLMTIKLLIQNYDIIQLIFSILLLGSFLRGFLFRPIITYYSDSEINFIKPAPLYPHELFLAKLLKKILKIAFYLLVTYITVGLPFLYHLRIPFALIILLFFAALQYTLILVLSENIAFYLKHTFRYLYKKKKATIVGFLFLLFLFLILYVSLNIHITPAALFVNIFYFSLFGFVFYKQILIACGYLIIYFLFFLMLILVLAVHYYFYIEPYTDTRSTSVLPLLKSRFPDTPTFIPKSFFSILYKDFIVNLRTTYVQMIILSYFLFFVLYFLRSIISPLTIISVPVLQIPVGLLVFGLVALLLTPVAVFSFSEELSQAWILKTAPVDLREVILAKYVIYLIMTLIASLPIYAVLLIVVNNTMVAFAILVEYIFAVILYVIIGINVSINYSPILFEKEFPFSGLVVYATEFIFVSMPILFILVFMSFHWIGLVIGTVVAGLYTWMAFNHYFDTSVESFLKRGEL